MTTSNKIPDELLRSLEATTVLMSTLLDDIKEHSTSLTLVKAKLESLSDNVETLSHIVRDGNGKGSMITRLALVEKATENIEDSLDDLKVELRKDLEELKDCMKEKEKDEKTEDERTKEYKREKMLARLKIIAVAAPGLVALALMLIKMFTGAETP